MYLKFTIKLFFKVLSPRILALLYTRQLSEARCYLLSMNFTFGTYLHFFYSKEEYLYVMSLLMSLLYKM